MSTLIWLAAASALVLAATAWICRPGWLRWAALFVGATALQPVVWLLVGQELTVFRLLKTIAVALGGLVIMAMRRRSGSLAPWDRALWWLMVINIALAAGVETLSDNWMNPLAGLLLCLTVADAAHVERDADGRIGWRLGWPFVLLYSLWDLVFIGTSGPAHEQPGIWAGLALIHLGVPLVMAVGDVRRWGEARVVSLYLCVMLLDLNPGEPWLMPTPWYRAEIAVVSQAASLGLAAGLVVHELRRGRLRTPASRLGQRLGLRRAPALEVPPAPRPAR